MPFRRKWIYLKCFPYYMKKVKLLPETERKLLDVLFYSPNVSTTSVKELYNKVKNRGITLDQVKN